MAQHDEEPTQSPRTPFTQISGRHRFQRLQIPSQRSGLANSGGQRSSTFGKDEHSRVLWRGGGRGHASGHGTTNVPPQTPEGREEQAILQQMGASNEKDAGAQDHPAGKVHRLSPDQLPAAFQRRDPSSPQLHERINPPDRRQAMGEKKRNDFKNRSSGH